MKLFSQLEALNLSALLRTALAEDLGQGDITTAATVAPGQRGRADILVKESREHRVLRRRTAARDLSVWPAPRPRSQPARMKAICSSGRHRGGDRGAPGGISDWRAHGAQSRATDVGNRDHDPALRRRQWQAPARASSTPAKRIRGSA